MRCERLIVAKQAAQGIPLVDTDGTLGWLRAFTHDLIATTLFRVIHAFIGILDQAIRSLGTVIRNGNTNTCRDLQIGGFKGDQGIAQSIQKPA